VHVTRSTFLAAVPMMALVTGRAAAQTAPQAPQSLRVGATANDTYAEAYYAQDMGFFTSAGLNVDITTFPNGAALSAGVASGALDIGVSNPVQLANAIVHGIPFVFIAGGAFNSTAAPTAVLCVAANSPIKSAQDLIGKTIAVSALKDSTYLAVSLYLSKNGIGISSVQLTELPFSEMGAALQRGTVQAAVISEPSSTRAMIAEEARVFTKIFDSIANSFLISGWFTTADWYRQNTALAKRFTSVIYDTARWANAHHDQSGAILEKYAHLDPETTRRMSRCTYATALDPRQIDPLLALSAQANLTDRKVSAAEMIAAQSGSREPR
jgi:NitT/TauT family transport system substrate-binding protein